MLKKLTSKGTAIEKVKKCEDTNYGAMEYNYLKEYYDQGMNKQIHLQENIEELMLLEL